MDIHSIPMAPSTQLSSATAIADNEDVLSEILILAPVKSLVRFKSVSKHWLSLISLLLQNPNRRLSGFLIHKTPPENLRIPLRRNAADLHFVSLNSSLSRDPPPFKSLNFLQSNGNFSGPIENKKPKEKGSGIFMHQSCNGLLLCSNFYPCSYYLLNPTTKQHVALDPPPSCALLAYDTIVGFHIAFDPSKSPHYKVICVSSVAICVYQIHIYSSETRCWMVSGNKFAARRVDRFTEGVFWNGNIHWSVAWLRFNVDLECLERMPAAPVYRRYSCRGKRYRYFGESNDHLHLIQESGKEFRVFEMERDYSGWFVKYHVDLGVVVAAFPTIALSILGVIHQENEDESFLLLNVPGKVVSYNLKDGTLKELLDSPEEKIDERRALLYERRALQFTYYDTYQYIETLAPV